MRYAQAISTERKRAARKGAKCATSCSAGVVFCRETSLVADTKGRSEDTDSLLHIFCYCIASTAAIGPAGGHSPAPQWATGKQLLLWCVTLVVPYV